MIRKKILLVDADGFSREWERADADQGEYEFLVACSGVQAYESAVYDRPDLIVMNAVLPELNGDECCCRLKTHPDLKKIPVVLVVDLAHQDMLDRCRRAGCDDLIPGPVDWSQMTEVCRKHLRIQLGAAPRIPVRMTVFYGPASDRRKLSNYSINISAGGLFIETDSPLPMNTPLDLEFVLPGQPLPISCQGRVAWVNEPPKKQNPFMPCGMGVQFLDLSVEDMHLVRSFMRQEFESRQPG
ncbi:MAG: TIGR02266 family protein [Syntrophotaleaceae bacterium]